MIKAGGMEKRKPTDSGGDKIMNIKEAQAITAHGLSRSLARCLGLHTQHQLTNARLVPSSGLYLTAFALTVTHTSAATIDSKM